MIPLFPVSGLLGQVSGYVFPNEKELQWSALIVLYPYITGLVAGAFILASLVRVFNAHEVRPVYRLALLTSLAFLLCATLPLVAHLGHPERAIEIMMTPHLTSAMAIFGFVYLWYLLIVLLLEVYFDFRKDMVIWRSRSKGVMKLVYSILTLGVYDLSPKALKFDDKAGRFITILGIPSAVLLHGYVGFIFGSLKSNPWWSSELMPLIFLLSAIVSGISLVLVIYMVTCKFRKVAADIVCVRATGRYLMFALLFDLTLEGLDLIHRLYEAGESLEVMNLLTSGYLFYTIFLVQFFFGGIVPMLNLAFLGSLKKLGDRAAKNYYFINAILVLVGVLAMRWNVVIGGQLFSKSLVGLTTYRIALIGHESLTMFAAIFALPFVILVFLVKLLPPWHEAEEELEHQESGALAGAAVPAG